MVLSYELSFSAACVKHILPTIHRILHCKMASAALSVIPVSYVTETVIVDICAPKPTSPSRDPLTTIVSSQTSTHNSPTSTTQVELSTEQSSYGPQSAASVASPESSTSSDAGAILTNSPPSSIPQPQTTAQRSTVTPTPLPTPSATVTTSQISMSSSLTAAASIDSSTQAHQPDQSDLSGSAVTITSTPMSPVTDTTTSSNNCTSTSGRYCVAMNLTSVTAIATETYTAAASTLPTSTIYVTPVAVTEPVTSSNSCTSTSGQYCVAMDLTSVTATATETSTVAASILSTSTIYVTGAHPTTAIKRSISSPSTDKFAPITLSPLPTILSPTVGHDLPRDASRESAVQVSNKGFVTGVSGHNYDHGPMVPYFFIPVLIIAVVFSLMVERRIRRVVNGVMENIAMERRRGRRL